MRTRPVFAHQGEPNFQHPAARAALAARNEVAAEMSVAGRAGLLPGERCWSDASVALLEPGDSAWAVASDEFQRLREDLVAEGAPEVSADAPVGLHRAAMSAVAVPVGAAVGAVPAVRGKGSGADGVRRTGARRRRERMETAFWFAVGGAGGLALAIGVRALEVVVAWL
jgi:hypothetical protein